MAFNISKFAENLPANRPVTIETVTQEILDLKRDWVLNTFDIGVRLNEAKELLPHGEWLPWLQQKVEFSERTAQKFMALAREYAGSPQTVAELGSEKAFALLALPPEERQQVVEEGAVVNGKTKAAADLTAREVKQIVAERRDPAPASARYSAEEYLLKREEEDRRFKELVHRFSERFLMCLVVGGSRQDGVVSLKEQLKRSASHSASGGWYGSQKGLTVYDADKKPIERTWTEVWDCLAVLTLQEAARPKPEPEGQMMISGWMPGGTNPGHACTCAVLVDFREDGNLHKAFYRWTGKRWEFDKFDEAVAIQPTKWMELPEIEGLE